MASSNSIRVYWIVDCASGGMNVHSAPGPHPELAIQVRDKMASGRQLYDTARAWIARGYRVYVNDRVDVALAVGAEGVQLPGGGLRPAEVRALAPHLKCGMSIHSANEVGAEADFYVLSPIFESPGKGAPIGLAAIREAAARGVPILALGGVETTNARDCLDAGASGVAAIRAGAELARVLLA